MKTPAKSAGLGKVFGLVAILTVLSKVAGLARDVIALQAFGTTIVADAYNYAYMFTGNIFVLFGGLGGPFHSSSVAILTPKKNDENIGRLAGQLMLYTVIVLSVIALIVFFFAPQLVAVTLQTQGHTADYTEHLRELTTTQLKIMSPLIVMSGAIGLCYGILNVYGQVFTPSLSPAIASVTMIAAILFWPDRATGLCLAWGTTVGAAGQLLLQFPGLIRSHLKWAMPLTPEPALKQYFAMLWPATISTSIGYLTVYVDMFFTSQLQTGSWTAIVNSNRLVQLPLGVLLTAMLVPILPRFTEQFAENRIDDLKAEFRRALSFLWFLALPVAALLLAMPGPILQVLFERGQFNAESRELVTAALVFLVPSIFFYVGRDLITRVFYAQHDSKTPYHVAMAAIVVKGILDWLLVRPLGVSGISLATSLVTVFNLAVLTFLMRKKIGNLGFTQLLKPVAIMFLASTACGLVAYGMHNAITSNVHLSPFITALISVSVASSLGLAAYAVICVLFKLHEPTMLLERFKGKLKKGNTPNPD